MVTLVTLIVNDLIKCVNLAYRYMAMISNYYFCVFFIINLYISMSIFN